MADDNINLDDSLSFHSYDNPKKVLDIKTSTVNGLLKILAEEVLFRYNSLEGIKEFRGHVYRVSEDLGAGNPSWSIVSFFKKLLGTQPGAPTLVKTCKVRIPEIHACLPTPEDYDVSIMDKLIIDLYDDFILDPFGGQDIAIAPGDIVTVTYENLSNFTGGKILKVLKYGGGPPPPAIDKEELEKLRDKFKNAGQMRPGDDVDVQYINGDPAGTMLVRPVLGSSKKLRAEVADMVNELGELAKRENITLKINSGYRNQEQQNKLYNDYLDYEAGRSSVKGHYAIKKPGGHGKGNASDFQVGGSFTSPEYLFLQRNAPKYDIYNSGKYFAKEKEAWHWEYFPKGDAARTQNQAVKKAIEETGLEDT